jgi:hypothetical protein
VDAPFDLPDPRRWPAATASPAARALHRHAERSLAATASAAAAALDDDIDATLTAWLRDGDGGSLGEALASAPSVAIHRHLWRRVAACEAALARDAALSVVLFAIPLVVVVAGGTADTTAALPAVLPDPGAVVRVLREHGALGGSEQFTVSAALVDRGALALDRLPTLLADARRLVDSAPGAPLTLAPAPLAVQGASELAHLRFIVGSLVCAPSADPLRDATVGAWAMPLARVVSNALAPPGVTVLALPRAPQRLVAALATGRAAQREIALQLFAGNALRRLRASFGEPTAVISAHEAADAPGGGELRLSLSSPFGPRDAEGFRCPLAPYERVPDVVAAIVELLHDCRVADIRAMPGIQPDRDAGTGLLRFSKPDAPGRAVH